MEQKIKLPEHVVLIDVEFLNFMLTNMKGFLEQQVGRELANVSMADLLTCLALDAKVEEGAKEIQVLLMHDKSITKVEFADPSDLEKELNGVAFKSSLGEFSFAAVSTENITSTEELYQDLLQITFNSETVKKVMVVAPEDYDNRLLATFKDDKLGKELYQFRISEPQSKLPYNWDMLVFPIMKAFGVEGSEI